MHVTFVGVGEAFDESLPNTSVLVRVETEVRPVTLLLDCGFSVPQSFWQLHLGADALDAIWISHFHADHAFGLPALLVRFWEEKRKNELYILGQSGIESFVRRCLDLAYPNFYPRLGYPLRCVEAEPEEPLDLLGLSWRTAPNDHPQRDLALRLQRAGESLFYSGDGRPTAASRTLAQGAQLAIHEAFCIHEEVPGHGTVAGCIEMARRCRIEKLALVHIQRQVRSEGLAEIARAAAAAEPVEVLVPEPGNHLSW